MVPHIHHSTWQGLCAAHAYVLPCGCPSGIANKPYVVKPMAVGVNEKSQANEQENTDAHERSEMHVDSDAWFVGEFDASDETEVEVTGVGCDVSPETAADFEDHLEDGIQEKMPQESYPRQRMLVAQGYQTLDWTPLVCFYVWEYKIYNHDQKQPLHCDLSTV